MSFFVKRPRMEAWRMAEVAHLRLSGRAGWAGRDSRVRVRSFRVLPPSCVRAPGFFGALGTYAGGVGTYAALSRY